MKTCQHLETAQVPAQHDDKCTECVAMGDTWRTLRLCLTCGHVGCCNNSKNKHAQKHFDTTGHPVIKSLEEGDDWLWCYIDKIYGGTPPSPFKIMLRIIKRSFHRKA